MTDLEKFRQTIDVVIPFAEQLKAKMIAKGARRARIRCPRHPEEEEAVYVRARLSGSRAHLAMACDDPSCIMRMIE